MTHGLAFMALFPYSRQWALLKLWKLWLFSEHELNNLHILSWLI